MRQKPQASPRLRLIGWIVLALAGPLSASGPVPIAPSSSDIAPTDRLGMRAERCPTFSWTAVAGAHAYEIEIARTEQEVPVDPTRHLLPGAALAWVPDAASCLEEGTYAWRVRAYGEEGAGSWSRSSRLRIGGRGPLDGAVQRALNGIIEGRLTSEEQLAILRELDLRVEPSRTGGAALRQPAPGAAETTPSPRDLGLQSATVQADDGLSWGVWSIAAASSVVGESASATGIGVQGTVSLPNGTNRPITGNNNAGSGYGVTGEAIGTPQAATDGAGVYGESMAGTGVEGFAFHASGVNSGVVGETTATVASAGICGLAADTLGSNVGVSGVSSSTAGYDFYAGGFGVDYSPFTGGHDVRLEERFTVRSGMVVSATGHAEARRLPDGSTALSSNLPSVALADRENDPAVFGVLVATTTLRPDHWTEHPEGSFATVNALGEGRVWVVDANGPVGVGDYITSSRVPGYAQRQDSDALRASTLGKVIEAVDWPAVSETVTFGGRSHKVALVAVVYTSG
jgi:hypothetical protein